MGAPVVHFEVIGRDPAGLRGFYGDLFGWQFQIGDATTDAVSQPGSYGFIDGATTGEGSGINGGVGGGENFTPQVLFYVGVPNVEDVLRKAEELGGTRQLSPEGTDGTLVVGRFTDPEGNLIGVAGAH